MTIPTIILLLSTFTLLLLLILLYVSIRYKGELLSEKVFERFRENIPIFKMGVVEVVMVFSPLPILERVEVLFHLLFSLSLILGVVISLYLTREHRGMKEYPHLELTQKIQELLS